MSKVKQGRTEAARGGGAARAQAARSLPARPATAAKTEAVQRPASAVKRPAKVAARQVDGARGRTARAKPAAHVEAKAAVRSAALPTAKRTAKPATTPAPKGKRATRGTKRGAVARKAALKPSRKKQQPATAPERVMRVRELVPQSLCGKRTSVEHLFRVDERCGSEAQTHLVFHDRHGWYCYHGATCPAVGEVRRIAANV